MKKIIVGLFLATCMIAAQAGYPWAFQQPLTSADLNAAFAARATFSTGSLTTYHVLVGNGLGDISAISGMGLSGYALVSNGAFASPSFQQITAVKYGNSPPSAPTLGSLWLNISVSPYVLDMWDGAVWVIVGTLDATAHGWGTPWASVTGSPTTLAGYGITDGVRSVALSMPSIFSVSGSPITSSGTLTATLGSQTANYFFAAPNGSSAAPSFRAMVAADVPTLNQNTTGTSSNVTGTVLPAKGGTGITSPGASGNVLTSDGAGNWASSAPVVSSGTVTHTAGALVANALVIGNGSADLKTTVLTGVIVGNGASAPTAVTAPSGTIVGTSDTQNLTNKTVTGVIVTGYTETTYAPSSGTAFTVALTNGTLQSFTTSGNVTITLPSPATGSSFLVHIHYGGTHTVTWAGGGTIEWVGGSAPVATSVSGKSDVYTCFSEDATYTYCGDGGRNFPH